MFPPSRELSLGSLLDQLVPSPPAPVGVNDDYLALAASSIALSPAQPCLKQSPQEQLYQEGLTFLLKNRIAEAKNRFITAAFWHHIGAYVHLHRLSLLGIVEPPNLKQAEYWKQKTAARFSWIQQRATTHPTPDAQCNLAWCYFHGLGTAPDKARAVELYKLVVDQSYPIAQLSLGWCNFHAQGVAIRNIPEALRLYQLATEQGDAVAPFYLGEYYANKYKLEMTPNLALAVEYYRIAAEAGNLVAQYELGVCYLNGVGGLPRSREKIFYWYLKSARGGYVLAEYGLGLYYASINDMDSALLWYRKAAAQGFALAKLALAKCYATGNGMAVNLQTALTLSQEAVDQNCMEAVAFTASLKTRLNGAASD